MIYLDNAATTSVREDAFKEMLPYFGEKYGNPSSKYDLGTNNKAAIEEARKKIAKTLNASGGEIFFTSGGTESDNWALKSVAEQYQDKGKHIITSKIEHHAILHTCEYLAKKGYEITYLNVDEYGIIKMDELKNALRSDTILISVMAANNEVGSIQPVAQIGELARAHKVLFHTDAVQAYCHIPLDVKEMKVDFLSASGHKIGGPKGTGILYVREGILLPPFIHGGAQEKKMRAGTENVPGIVGMASAAEKSSAELTKNMRSVCQKRDYLIHRLLSENTFARLNGHPTERLPGNISVSFQFVDGESLIVLLNMEGICTSGGSACTAGQGTPSHVLKSMGLPDEIAYGTLRLTLDEKSTKEELDHVADCICEIVTELREKSVDYNNMLCQMRRNGKMSWR